MNKLEKREWFYTQKPSDYCISGCPKCGNEDTQWSEYKKHLWCETCEIDFIPEHNGMFEGPITLQICELVGIRFDRYYTESGAVIIQEEYLND